MPAAVEPVSPAAEQPGAEPAAAPAPALILLESADDAGVCDVNGMCL
ncbi:hypothetical protein SAMN06264365_12681 [Actinoplanes regularis]|uniref:Uncharacterized protein n=1 Tax=Actinoplanes regularis TaxID=52697 RepID=A0A239HXP1_9ACTN|nr:hypothetical protein Are01nite_77500 [Actinoplanes regularis]SNS86041.1 hypothetical protein SAMN06264365_12681 [Actinoplanes regularis]